MCETAHALKKRVPNWIARITRAAHTDGGDVHERCGAPEDAQVLSRELYRVWMSAGCERDA